MRLSILFVFVFLSTTSFSQKSANLYPFFRDGKMGYMNIKKEIIFKAEFDTAYVFHQLHGAARQDFSWYIIYGDGSKKLLKTVTKVTSPFRDFPKYSPYSCHKNPGLRVFQNGNWEYLDVNGQRLSKSKCRENFEFDDVEEEYFRKLDKYIKHENGKYGYSEREIEIPIEWDTIIPWSTVAPDTILFKGKKYPRSKSVTRFVVRRNDKYGMIDEKGNVLIELSYIHHFKDQGKDIFFSKDGVRWMKFETDGKKSWTQKYHIVNKINYQYLVIKKGSKYGLIDRKENVKLPFENDTIYNLNYSNYAVERGDSCFVYGYGLKRKLAINGHSHFSLLKGSSFYITNFNKKYGVINSKGETVIPHNYATLTALKGTDYFVFSNKEKKGVLSNDGKVVLKARYTEVLKGFSSCFLVRRKNQLFYVSYNNIEFK